jgi:hypothetical protein
MKRSEIEAKLLKIIERCKGMAIPEEQLDEISELTRVAEYGVALENLCVQLVEYDVVVPSGIVEMIKELGHAMNIGEKYWMRLQTSSN